MKSYTICRAKQAVALCGDAKAGAWAAARSLAVDEFCWYKAGQRQATAARVLYDDEALYVQFICEDRHIYSAVTELNGPVCTDSCVEFFAMINPAKSPDYFNFEVNCCGKIHLGFGPDRHHRIVVTPALACRLKIVTSVPTATKNESPSDNGWWVAAELPLDMLSEFTGAKIAPKTGDVWRANFYRCGGKTDEQYGVWSPIKSPKADFHRPECFSEVKFA